MKTSEAITTAINLAALLFVGIQILLSRKGQRDEWRRLRRQATIEASISAAPYREALKAVLPWNDRDPATVAKFIEEAGGDQSKLAPVREYFNCLQELAVGVRQGVFDLETLKMLQGTRIVDTTTSFQPYFHQFRNELGRPSIWEDVDVLAALLEPQLADQRDLNATHQP